MYTIRRMEKEGCHPRPREVTVEATPSLKYCTSPELLRAPDRAMRAANQVRVFQAPLHSRQSSQLRTPVRSSAESPPGGSAEAR